MGQGRAIAEVGRSRSGQNEGAPASIVANANQLLSHGHRGGREIALQIINRAIASIDSYTATKKTVRLSNHNLVVADRAYDLSRVGKIYVVGAGKATISMARALEDVLGSRISGGHVIVKHGQSQRLKRITVTEASHPLPNKEGLEGARAILRIAEEADRDDLVFCLITGGASALMPLPAKGISLEDKRKVTELLLDAGADVNEINCVRNHLSQIKGGRLSELIDPARIVNLVVVDETDRLLWGPTAPDNSTFKDALEVLQRYGLWKRAPNSVKRHIRKGFRDPSLETLKDKDFRKFRIQSVILSDNVSICEAAEREAGRLGLNSLILTTTLRGESSEVGAVLGRIAREVETFHRPVRPPCVLIAGGETTVTLGSKHGRGGPSQELALAASREISGSGKIVVAAVDTDGTDGPTDAAGGMVDGYTFEGISRGGTDPFGALKSHDSHKALMASQDVIVTNFTGTNVMDLNLVVVTE